jgi:hypothetical protein
MVKIHNAFATCRPVCAIARTTRLLEIAAGFGDRALYAAGDDPDVALPGFWEGRWQDAEKRAKHGQQVSYWREEPLEIDAVFDGSWGEWAVEVKTGRFDGQALGGLLEFCRRHSTFKPLVITAPGDERVAKRHGIEAVNGADLLISGPPIG